jgi:hypothetical protein
MDEADLAQRVLNWLPAPAGPFYLVLRNYASVRAVAEGLKNSVTFKGPPPIVVAT